MNILNLYYECFQNTKKPLLIIKSDGVSNHLIYRDHKWVDTTEPREIVVEAINMTDQEIVRRVLKMIKEEKCAVGVRLTDGTPLTVYFPIGMDYETAMNNMDIARRRDPNFIPPFLESLR